MQQPNLILDHMGYVRGIAGGMVRKYGCFDLFPDLCQEGYLALLHAAERFDETLGLKFWTLAYKRVWGAMIDAFRRWHWDGHYHFESVKQVESHIQYVSLTDLDIGAEGDDASIIADIKAALATLDDKERYVIIKTYLEGYTLLEVGKEWDLQIAWVSTIRSRGLCKMRAYMEAQAA